MKHVVIEDASVELLELFDKLNILTKIIGTWQQNAPSFFQNKF